MFGDAGCKDNPPHIRNGYYNMTEERSCWGYPSSGSHAEYHCDEDHKLLGSALYTCTDGSWCQKSYSGWRL
ncbi:hypothetical protein CEXT_184381 [Caerostris extrusa]|uniref:Sushi domain-containing protein n=1 Tax=Caerostris extrusa TaxID=172846 RepID=A0AAV4N7I0_CAEEX|nr:hypothetical protein CEXT_184381 [Caerostris extrusa]